MAHVLIVEGWISDSGNLILKILEQMGHSFTFVTRNPELYQSPEFLEGHPLLTRAKEIIVTETNDFQRLIEAVRHLKFEGVLTACDYYFDAVRALADAFELPCPLPSNLKTIRQKHLMRQCIEDSGLPNANFRIAQNWASVLGGAEALGYPLIIKPVDLGSSSFVRFVSNEEELLEAFEELQGFSVNYRGQVRNKAILLEAVLEGEEISVESISINGITTIVGITDKSIMGFPYFVETGHMHPASLSQEKSNDVKDYVLKVLNAVGFDHGVAHTEVKLTERGPIIVEINPRVPGNYIVELVALVTGINLLESFVKLSLGESPEMRPQVSPIKSAASFFIVPPFEGKIQRVEVPSTISRHPNVLRFKIQDVSEKTVKAPKDNACYLGHLIIKHEQETLARPLGEQLIKSIEFIYE